MLVKLTYFKRNGKYYTSGEYETNEKLLFEIWDEVRMKRAINDLPGCAGDFIILVEVPEHQHNHPKLII